MLAARNTYGRHYGDLTPDEKARIPELIALEMEIAKRGGDTLSTRLAKALGG